MMILQVDHLTLSFNTGSGPVQALRDISFSLNAGEIVGIVGESGSGKSVAAKAIMRLLPQHSTKVEQGSIVYRGINLLNLTEQQMRSIRGQEIAMIFQDPMTSLNPTKKIGSQIAESFLAHYPHLKHREAEQKTLDLLTLVDIPNPKERFHAYPHMLSGGMRQRAMIAIAIACSPKILIADEPTTALDMTVQAQILELLRNIALCQKTSIILITHDLSVVAGLCDKVLVMYGGKIVEEGPTEEIFFRPQHPYTYKLLRSIPSIQSSREIPLLPIHGKPPSLHEKILGCAFKNRCEHAMNVCALESPPLESSFSSFHKTACWLYAKEQKNRFSFKEPPFSLIPAHSAPLSAPSTTHSRPLLEIKNLSVSFALRGKLFKAVSNLSLSLYPGETLGLIGESGSGKSTIARAILKLEPLAKGSVFFEEQSIFSMNKQETKLFRKQAQVIFQDPYASLNPRMSTREILAEPLDIHELDIDEAREPRLCELMNLVGLSASLLGKYPHEFSGGQRQRIGIARALAARPRFIVCDEPLSSLDVSVQAQVINLLKTLQTAMGLSYLFITHDLRVVPYLSHRIAVLYLGTIVELADVHSLYSTPLHPYTQALLSAIPIPNPIEEKKRSKILLKDELSQTPREHHGCIFYHRCPKAQALCAEQAPTLKEHKKGHEVACHFV